MRVGSETEGASQAEAEVINASELAEFAFCCKSWWLHRVCGLPPANRDALEAGLRAHGVHNQSARQAVVHAVMAKLLLGAGVLILAVGLALLLLAGDWQP
ncbi:MAG: hypothetical protein ACUVX9_08950 [Anaerolineae bacterium]